MSRIQNVAITLLFIISAVSALDSRPDPKDSDPVDINGQTVPVPNLTEINKTTVTDPTLNNSTNITTETPATTITPSTKSTITTTAVPTSTVTPKSTPTTATTTKSSTISTEKPIVTTTLKPTGAPPSTPIPSHRRFDGPSFIGGIVLALGLVAIGFVAFKFYKARTELNYHTL